MTQQLEMFEDTPVITPLFALGDGGFDYLQAVLDILDAPFVIRRRKLDGSLIASEYAHLTLNEAALLFIENNAKPAQASAWVLALLTAQVRPPQREAIGLSPKQRLKRRSGHQAREPPQCNVSNVANREANSCTKQFYLPVTSRGLPKVGLSGKSILAS